MNLSVGIVGLANVGKSTLFNALLKRQVAGSANYPFTTIEPNVGVVEVPDSRLAKLAEVIGKQLTVNSELKMPPIVPATVRFVDIAGLIKGAHKGEGLGNQFLSHIREVDLIVFVVRDFSDPNVINIGSDPNEDLEVLKTELLLKDLETIDKRLGSREQGIGSDKENLDKAKGLVEKGKWLRDEMTDQEIEKIADLQLLSSKKTIVIVNSDEKDLIQSDTPSKESPLQGGIRICAKMEAELAELSVNDQKQYLKEVGIEESGLDKVINKAYEVLGLVSFYTAGEKEVRAWTIKKGSLAPAAAGVIHSDFERGFIAADMVDFDKFVEIGGWQAARSKGFVKTIGKSEVIKEGMVVEFKFSL
ncbi:redox-regulated ATPase YchF [Candidatus Curtissbacteria bacterium RIFCSPLOWO2_01_FULL_38_11b]|uniref:Redox-regulated ATPase YchF n=1 Tax=Candidatus Curtissbacteria bacterium RIFCSPLOWO2_01_FULL_38_11b TaxID=1797725 RepID=A0A1F5H089_9BACT|nr:MAG: redox-regulated ATPase YchF [Candidatus Curtissbacteria bacterium RIFCSPLOWO2_01_FULL_38_11b]